MPSSFTESLGQANSQEGCKQFWLGVICTFWNLGFQDRAKGMRQQCWVVKKRWKCLLLFVLEHFFFSEGTTLTARRWGFLTWQQKWAMAPAGERPSCCFSLPPSGLNAGAFYALCTLLNRMVIFHYTVRVFPKPAGSWEKAISRVGRSWGGSMLWCEIQDLEGGGSGSQPHCQ